MSGGLFSEDPVLEHLLPIVEYGRQLGDVPLLSSPEWAALPAADLRKAAAVARAAMAWHTDGTPMALRLRLLDELAVSDLLARWRVRMAGHDVRGETDWSRVQDVVWARRGAAA
jgi:hypothetical protein